MKVIGLTGGIASGKSTVARWFQEESIPVIDTDFVYKELSKPKKVLYNTLVEAFGKRILSEDDSINWRYFATLIFNDDKLRERLNQITHPIIRQEVVTMLQAEKDKGTDIVCLVVPLLFESNFHQLCQATLCVYTSQGVQLKRLMERDHLEKDAAKKRIRSQMPLDKKRKLARFVIDNSFDLAGSKAQFDKILAEIRRE